MWAAAFDGCYAPPGPKERPRRAVRKAALPALCLGELLARAHDGAGAYHGGCCLAPVAANALHCLLCPPAPRPPSDNVSLFTCEQVAEFKEAFDLFDRAGDGFLATAEVGMVFRSIGQNPLPDELSAFARNMDPLDTGWVDLPSFLSEMARVMLAEPHSESLTDPFRVFDRDGSGWISAAELRHVLINIGEKLTDAEVDEMICEADVDGDGQINYEEFVKMMMSK